MAVKIRDTARHYIGSRMPAKSLALQHTIRPNYDHSIWWLTADSISCSSPQKSWSWVAGIGTVKKRASTSFFQTGSDCLPRCLTMLLLHSNIPHGIEEINPRGTLDRIDTTPAKLRFTFVRRASRRRRSGGRPRPGTARQSPRTPCRRPAPGRPDTAAADPAPVRRSGHPADPPG